MGANPLRAFSPTDFLALDRLFTAFSQEAPEITGLMEAALGSPEGLRLLPGESKLAGFAFLPGAEVRILCALHAQEATRRDSLLRDALEPHLHDGTLALMAPERFGTHSMAATLAELGFQRLERVDMIQDQARVRSEPLQVPDGLRLIDWDDARAAEAAGLLSASNMGGIDGLFLCFPHAPSPEACLRQLNAITEGAYGEFLPDVSAMLLSGNRLVGLLLATLAGPDEIFLYELTLAREVQGQGLAGIFIRRIQEGARQKGVPRIRFMWCDRNRAVRRLFPPETIALETREPWWVWLSGGYRLLRRKRDSMSTGG